MESLKEFPATLDILDQADQQSLVCADDRTQISLFKVNDDWSLMVSVEEEPVLMCDFHLVGAEWRTRNVEYENGVAIANKAKNAAECARMIWSYVKDLSFGLPIRDEFAKG